MNSITGTEYNSVKNSVKDHNNKMIKTAIDELTKHSHLIKLYAKKKCKECNGRGVKVTSIFDKSIQQWVEQRSLCGCVKKNIIDEVSEDG